jgi:hypothetical protein
MISDSAVRTSVSLSGLLLCISCIGTWSCQLATESPAPELVVFDATVLAEIKGRINAGEISQARIDTLLAVAEEQLAIAPVSVMDKRLLPPSGDRHDYLTRAPYFWPNPNTPDGLPFVKRDGRVYDENITGTDRPGRGVFDTRVITLGLAYYLTDRDAYAEGAAEQLRTWFIDPETRMNPHMNYSQGVPGIMNGSEWGSIDNWQWPTLLDAIRLLRSSKHWTSSDDAAVIQWFSQYGEWLDTSPLGERYDLMWNNHATFYDAQRASIALFTGNPERARQILKASWHRRIDHGIEGDGRQLYELERTRSFAYSNFNLRAYMTLAAIADNVGLDLWNQMATDGSGIRAAVDYLAPYADSSRTWPHVDIHFDRTAVASTLHWAAIAYGDDSYRQRLTLLPGYPQLRGARTRQASDLYFLFLDP